MFAGMGTAVENLRDLSFFKLSSIDRIPIGSIGDTFFGLTIDQPEMDYHILFANGEQEFTLDYRMIRERMGDVPLSEIPVCTWIKETVEEEKSIIFGGILDEIIS